MDILDCGQGVNEAFDQRETEAALTRPPGSAKSEFENVAVMLWAIQRRMVRGCGNHGCRIGKIEGMAPNGPCKCSAREFARELRDIADILWPNTPGERPDGNVHPTTRKPS